MVSVTAVGDDLNYQWEINKGGNWETLTATGPYNRVLWVELTENHNGYWYRCKITDSHGQIEYSNTVVCTVWIDG